MNLDIQVDRLKDESGSHASQLQETLLNLMHEAKPAHVALAAGPVGPQYTAALDVAIFAVSQRHVSTHDRQHDFIEHRQVPNPRIPRLQGKLRSAESCLSDLQRKQRQMCHVCAGSGAVRCTKCGGSRRTACGRCRGRGQREGEVQKHSCQACGGKGKRHKKCGRCKGTGQIRNEGGDEGQGNACPRSRSCDRCGGTGKKKVSCDRCGGKGQIEKRGESKPCDRCQGRGNNKCQACHGRGSNVCGPCGGRGHGSNGLAGRIVNAEREVHGLRRKLSCEPAIVRQACPARWPYQVSEFCKRGTLQVRLSIDRAGADPPIFTDKINKQLARSDTRIENANPAIGLAADGIELPPDTWFFQSLIDQAAAQACSTILDAVVRHEHARLQSEVHRLRAAGNDADALETEVAAALVAAHLDRAASRRRLVELAGEL